MLHDRILLVHPRVEELDYYRRSLVAQGESYAINQATSLAEAEKHLEDYLPHLIIVHHDQDIGWGLDFLKRVLNSARMDQSVRTIVMLLSGEDEEAQNQVLDLTNAPIQVTYWIYNPQTRRVGVEIFRKHLENLYLTVQDLSRRRKSEEALVESEERFRQLVNNMEDIFWMADVTNKTIIYISSAYEKITNRPLHNLLFKPFNKWVEMIHWEDQDVAAKIFDIPQEQRIEWEYRIHTDTGEIKWLRERVFPILNSQNQIYRLAGLAEDITDRKLKEQEILRNRNLREAIFNEATDALFLVSPDTLLTLDCNQSAVKLFQAPHKQALIGIEGATLQKEPFSADEIEDINRQMKEKGYWTTEVEYLTLQGRSFWGNLAARPIEIGGQRINLVRVTDITVQKNAALELEKAFRHTQELSTLKSQFIAMTSHEFRTPLTIIGSSAGILKNFGDRLSLESRLEHLNTIQNYVEHANRLLADVLLLSQDSLGALRFSPVLLNVVDFTRKIIQSIKLTQDRSIEFQYFNETKNLQAHVDPQFIQQILINLILNAIKYSNSDTVIQVSLSLTKTLQSFEVKDYGIGIPEDAKDNLFDSFYRASNVGAIAGTGLGLNIVKRCVDLHKGEIHFISQLGKGTTFRVHLPRYAEVFSSKTDTL
jgi:PAS domain S-box-containing protein